MNTSTLRTIFLQNRTEKHAHWGLEFGYTVFFEHRRLEPLTILEIGVWHGHSLQAWREYFPNATLYGLDIHERCLRFHNPERKIFTEVCNQHDAEQLVAFANKVGKFDVIIDDGGHFGSGQQISLGTLWPFLVESGIYVIEDLHMARLPKYNDGEISTIDYLLQRVDGNAIHILSQVAHCFFANACFIIKPPSTLGVPARRVRHAV